MALGSYLRGESLLDAAADRRSLERAIERGLRRATGRTRLLIFFAGHGVAQNDAADSGDSRRQKLIIPDDDFLALVELDAENLALQPVAYIRNVTATAFDPAGSMLVTGATNGGVHLWNTSSLEQPTELLDSGDFIRAVTFSSNGALIAAARTSRLTVWNHERWWRKRIARFRTFQCFPEHLLFLSGDRLLAAGCNDGSIRIWDLRSPNGPAESIPGDGSASRGLVGDADDRWLLHATESGHVDRWLADVELMSDMVCEHG